MKTTCAFCLRLRLFLSVAGVLIAMIYVQPEGITRPAATMPSAQVIAWGMMALGTLGFALRYLAWKRGRK